MCFGTVNEWFISRRQMPKICGDNRCFRMDACFRECYRQHTGLEPKDGFSYKITTPRWRGQSK